MKRPPRPCTYPGCAALTLTGRCAKHPSAFYRNRQAQREYNQRRPEIHRFYHTARWAKLRAHLLSQSPVCVECERRGLITLATVVDHIIPLRERPELALTVDNLRTLCASCHGRIGRRVTSRSRNYGGQSNHSLPGSV